jgi:hypothetical protein
MPTTAGTTSGGLPYPGDASTPDVPRDLKALADAVEARFQAGIEVSTLQGATGPQLNLYHTAASADRKRVRLSTASGVTKLAARNDADTADTHVGLSLDNASGVVDFPSGISGTGATFAGAMRHTGPTLGFFNATPVTKPGSTAEIKSALAGLGLLTDGGVSPLDLDFGNVYAGNVYAQSGIVAFAANADTTLSRISAGRIQAPDLDVGVLRLSSIASTLTANGSAGFNSTLAVQSSLYVDGTGVKVQGASIGGGTNGIYLGQNLPIDVSAVTSGQRTLLNGSSTARIEQVLASLVRDLYSMRLVYASP